MNNITKKKNLSDYDPSIVPDGKGYRIGIVAALWNNVITDALLEGARDTLLEHGVETNDLHIERVPGTFELPTAAQAMLRCKQLDAVICIGCVIQGETRHFDFICDAVSNGITRVSLDEKTPVIFSVLTTNNMDQAQERAGGKHGNKGVEGAISALQMIHLMRKLANR